MTVVVVNLSKMSVLATVAAAARHVRYSGGAPSMTRTPTSLPVRQLHWLQSLRGSHRPCGRLRLFSSAPGGSRANDGTTHFGFETVASHEKQGRVHEVFRSVAGNYDVMNDLMSGTLHRLWKDEVVRMLTPMTAPGYEARVVDVAGGTGDIAFRMLDSAPRSSTDGTLSVVVCDINANMLDEGHTRAAQHSSHSVAMEEGRLSWVEGNAEALPLEDNAFDAYTIAFGIRNCTNINNVLLDAKRVLKPGGRFLCLEFSHLIHPLLQAAYDKYSFNVIPALGELVAQDRDSYQYLVESIRKFPKQDAFEEMLREAGFEHTTYTNLTAGVVAIHCGTKPLLVDQK